MNSIASSPSAATAVFSVSDLERLLEVARATVKASRGAVSGSACVILRFPCSEAGNSAGDLSLSSHAATVRCSASHREFCAYSGREVVAG